MRLILLFATLAAAVFGYWKLDLSHTEIKSHVEDLLHRGDFHTLEIRHTSAQIMEANRRDLLKTNRHKFLDPTLKFYPYLILEVKYRHNDDETREGVVLWDLTDGEMVIDTKDWQKTHGFGDCITANAERHEFKILNILARKGGTIDREGLSKILQVDNEILDVWIDSCRRKKLIVQTGNRYRLHMQNPRLKTYPETKIEERLVTQSHQNAERVSRRYSLSQIQHLTRSAFGQDFTIRRSIDVHLPVHCIAVQNPDGSIHTTHWNAMNGKRLFQAYFAD